MKTRPVLFIIATLIIGFVLGFLTSSQLRHQRMKPVRIYSSEARFMHDAYRFLQPDSLQAIELEPVIRKYARSSSDLHKEYRRNFEKIMNDYFSAIKPLLTEEQLESIRQTEKMRNNAVRRFRSDSTDSKRPSFNPDRRRDTDDYDRRRPDRQHDSEPDSLNQPDSLKTLSWSGKPASSSGDAEQNGCSYGLS